MDDSTVKLLDRPLPLAHSVNQVAFQILYENRWDFWETGHDLRPCTFIPQWSFNQMFSLAGARYEFHSGKLARFDWILHGSIISYMIVKLKTNLWHNQHTTSHITPFKTIILLFLSQYSAIFVDNVSPVFCLWQRFHGISSFASYICFDLSTVWAENVWKWAAGTCGNFRESFVLLLNCWLLPYTW